MVRSHFVARDFADVLEELREHGYRFEPDWFAPHLEFRFPRIGEVTLRGTTLELRHALEPWHVLGEEPVGGATTRFVDSSVERVQALVSGWVDERYVLACNGSSRAAFHFPARTVRHPASRSTSVSSSAIASPIRSPVTASTPISVR